MRYITFLGVTAFVLLHGNALAKDQNSEGYLTLSKEQAERQTQGLQRPKYPTKYFHENLRARMVLRLSVSATGQLDRVDAMRYQGAPELVNFAISYVKQNWRCSPFIHHGKPTPVRFETPMYFMIVPSPPVSRG
jgi:hypothetical protein